MHPACLASDQLLTECTVTRLRRAGPGGQHRNKVETAVRIVHRPTGLTSEASERRSQEENRQRALFRLRVNLAIDHREMASSAGLPSKLWQSRCRAEKIDVNRNHTDFPALLSEALDVLASCDNVIKTTAGRLGCTTSQLIKFIKREPRAIQQLNKQRAADGVPPVH